MSRERTGFAVGTDAAAAETPAERMPSELTVTVDDKSITMKGLNQINLIFGKNGCGKSRLLHAIQNTLEMKGDIVKFIKSERGEKSMLEYTSPSYEHVYYREDGESAELTRVFHHNEAQKRNFRGGVFYEFDEEHLRVVAGFLDNVKIFVEKGKSTPFNDETESTPGPLRILFGREYLKYFDIKDLSDGEIEIIYIVSNLIKFFDQIKSDHLAKNTIILIDELDVRLHPDVQYKIANFILKQVEEIASKVNLKIFITTHSTSVLSALTGNPRVSVCFMRTRSNMMFEPLSPPGSNVVKDILPIFGAHPLSQIFNESPIFLVEGTDEERIWQQAIRSSEGKLKLYPRETGGKTKGKMLEFEDACNRILPSIYDHPIAYSIRDRDGIVNDAEVPMPKYGEITRLRLYCRASENLLLSDEVIARIGRKHDTVINWDDVKAEVEQWLLKNMCKELRAHLASVGLSVDKWDEVKDEIKSWLSMESNKNKENPRYKAMVGFAEKFDRKLFELKKIRNTFLQIIEDTVNGKKSTALGRPLNDEEQITVNTDWEILVGQTIGKLVLSGIKDSTDKDSIINYLGPEVVNCLYGIPSLPSESASAARGERRMRQSTAANPQRFMGGSNPAAKVEATPPSTAGPTLGGAGTK